jgi:hypothetical protein
MELRLNLELRPSPADLLAGKYNQGLLEATLPKMLISDLCGRVQSVCAGHSPTFQSINSQAFGGCNASMRRPTPEVSGG